MLMGIACSPTRWIWRFGMTAEWRCTTCLFYWLDEAGVFRLTEDVTLGGMLYCGVILLPVWWRSGVSGLSLAVLDGTLCA